MKLLVTGGAGFIGSHFVRHMLAAGHEVVTVDKLTYAGNLANLEADRHHPNHRFYKLDICDRAAMAAVIEASKPDAIVHMAAETHVDRSIDGPEVFLKTNVMGTQSLLDAALAYYQSVTAEQQGAFRFLHLSTDEVFGALGPTGQFTEATPYQPNSPYAASKASSDLLVRSYFRTFGLPTVIVNASNNYGPHQYPEKLIPLMTSRALQEDSLPVYGDGQQVRDWLYVGDTARALEALLAKGRIGESYCVGGGNEITNLGLVETICQHLDVLRPRARGSYNDLVDFVTDRPGHDFRYATDISKIERETGWQPRMNFTEGLESTLIWYLSNQPKAAALSRIGLGSKTHRTVSGKIGGAHSKLISLPFYHARRHAMLGLKPMLASLRGHKG